MNNKEKLVNLAREIEELDLELRGFILEYACLGLYYTYFDINYVQDDEKTISDSVINMKNFQAAESLFSAMTKLKYLADHCDLKT